MASAVEVDRAYQLVAQLDADGIAKDSIVEYLRRTGHVCSPEYVDQVLARIHEEAISARRSEWAGRAAVLAFGLVALYGLCDALWGNFNIILLALYLVVGVFAAILVEGIAARLLKRIL